MGTDYHQATLDSDPAFEAFMRATRGANWRLTLSPRDRRFAAKNWNFVKLYGQPRPSIKKETE